MPVRWVISHACVCVLVTQSFPTLFNCMECSPPGSSIHGILQARKLEWIAIYFSRGSSRPRGQTLGLHCRQILYRLSHLESPTSHSTPISESTDTYLGVEFCTLNNCHISLFVFCGSLEKEMASHSSTLAWKIPGMEEPGGLQSMGSRRVGHDWASSLSLFTFMHWRRKWQPTPVFSPGESQGWGSLVGCCLWGRRESDMTEVT